MKARAAAGPVGLLLCLLLGGAAQADTDSAALEAEKAYQSAQKALGAQAWAEAELHFERVLMFNPEHAEARIQLALLLAQRGKLETASAFIESLIDDPRTPQAHRQRLSDLLAQLKRSAPLLPTELPSVIASEAWQSMTPAAIASPSSVIASEARQAMSSGTPAILQARISMGYSSNPYARADINSLTLTLPDGNVDLPVNQNIHAAPMLINSLSYLAPNLCGFEAQDQRWGASEQNFANKLLFFCYGTVGGEKIQTFASSLRAVDGNGRSSVGLAWPMASWRLTAQVFKEPELERQGYALRVDHLRSSSPNAQTLLYAEAEKSVSGMSGYVKSGFSREYALTSSLSLLTQLSLQQDFSGYSALLEYGARRRLVFAELGLQKDWGAHAGWNLRSTLQTGRRWSNLALFGYQDTTLQLSINRLL